MGAPAQVADASPADVDPRGLGGILEPCPALPFVGVLGGSIPVTLLLLLLLVVVLFLLGLESGSPWLWPAAARLEVVLTDRVWRCKANLGSGTLTSAGAVDVARSLMDGFLRCPLEFRSRFGLVSLLWCVGLGVAAESASPTVGSLPFASWNSASLLPLPLELDALADWLARSSGFVCRL